MAYTFGFLGWNNKDNHDKVWGYIEFVDGSSEVINFWGRREGVEQLTFKRNLPFEVQRLEKLKTSKIKKGYIPVTPDELGLDWLDRFETQFVMARLGETYYGE